MALAFEVHGPTLVTWNNAAGTASPANNLGYTDNNDLISLELEYPNEPIFTTRSGNIPEAFVHLGVIGRLTMTLVKWDHEQLEDLMHALPGSAALESEVGTIGGLKTSGSGNFSLKIASTASGDAYVMKSCWFDGPVRRLDFGNKPSRIGLNIICTPHEATPNTLDGRDEVYTVTGR
tara:strand:- start:21 stop:551 length:531 start_codon:yes stop_codon:yes gene_type:complete